MHGIMQKLVGASLALDRESDLPNDLVNGSSLAATRASPAESRRLETVPNAIRLMVFINRQLLASGPPADFLIRLI